MFAFIAALSQVGGIIIDKVVLTRRQVALHVFIPILFLFLFLTTVIMWPLLGRINFQLLNLFYIVIFLAMIVSAIIWNVYYYKGVQSEKLHEFETIVMFQPLLTILLAAIFLQSEQNLRVGIAGIIAATALIISHIHEKHLELSDGSRGLIAAVIFMSVELILIKILLNVFSPVALYAVRTGILLIFFYLYYHPKINRVSNHNVWFIFFTAVLGTAQMVTKFYGFEQLGVIYTSLILILSPILVYIISAIFMHERFKMRSVVSFVVILACILYATVLGR